MSCLIRLLFLMLFISLFCATATADQHRPLPADEAFQLSATMQDQQTVVLHWQIAPGYYLYQHQFHFAPYQDSEVRIGQPLFPTSQRKQIPGLGQFDIFQNEVNIALPLISKINIVILQIAYQGCSQQGFCYPPIKKLLKIDLSAANKTFTPLNYDPLPAAQSAIQLPTEQTQLNRLFNDKSWVIVVITFFGFGLLLSLTPCVLPMIPILSSIILGQKKQNTIRNFGLSLIYVVSMASTYAIAGVLFSWLGFNLQATLQQPWIIIVASFILILMALSLFGFYDLQLPENIRSRIATLTNSHAGGSYFSVAAMGGLSVLILSPCVTPPLVAALTYITQTGNIILGGLSLFSMGIGMGIPLLLIGAFGQKLMPKTGKWMVLVKNLLGFFLVGMTIWILSRFFPAYATMLLSAALIIGIAIYFGALATANDFHEWIIKIIGLILFIYGLSLIFAVMQGNTNPLHPLQISSINKETSPKFKIIKNNQELENALAKATNQTVILDFYADWCLACKQIDLQIFANPKMQQALKSFLLLRADVTANSAENHALQKELGVAGPPTIIFFNSEHEEVNKARIIGEISPQEFLKKISLVK